MRPTAVPPRVRKLAGLDPEDGYPLHTAGDIPAAARKTPGYRSRWTTLIVIVAVLVAAGVLFGRSDNPRTDAGIKYV